MVDGTIPDYEGRPVDTVAVNVSGQVPMGEQLNEVVLGIDDVVQVLSMYKVVGVNHKVDDKTGKLVRVQTLRPVEASLKPIDPTDPDDIGVIRALPYTPSNNDDDD